jgi:hypothetical protein
MTEKEEVPSKLVYYDGTGDISSYNEKKTGETDDRSIDDMEKQYSVRKEIDKVHHRYPYCIVWTPLPLISWFIPIIGHTGICT